MKRIGMFSVIVAVAIGLCACAAQPAVSTPSQASQPDTPTLLGRLPDQLLTAEAVSDAVGVTVESGVVEEEGTQLTFYAAEGYDKVMFSVQQCSRQYFDDYLSVYYAGMSNSTVLEDVGDYAVWSPDTSELLAFQNGYFVSVWVYLTDREAVSPERACRSLMTVMLFNLQLTHED